MKIIHEIDGKALEPEQRSYLEGFFAGIEERGFAFSAVMADPVHSIRAASNGAGSDAMVFEERVKHELHPLDAYPVLLEHAAANTAPERENIFRFKWHGLFHLTPNKEAFMCRLRIPGGAVKSYQFRELARVAQELTTGYVQITTRANLQIRLIEPKNAPEVLRRIQSVGLHSRGSGADNIRNITCNPTAGIDPQEWIDTLPLCQQLAQIIINDRSFYDLPRKFNIAFDGGGLVGSLEDTNDIGIRAVRINGGQAGIDPGVYFRIALGGATGHQAFARDLGVLARPEEILKVIIAVIRVYIANGSRENRKRARLKHLLENWSLQKYLEETEKILGYKLLKATSSPQESAATPAPHTHIGVYPQKQAGLNYIGVAVPVGQLTPKQMLRLADLADHYGSGELRLTIWQNLILPNIPDGYVETVKKSLVKMRLDWRPSHLRGGLIACTGNSYCKFASSNTKGHALLLADYLEKRLELDQPINIHLTGCPHSCAQHYIGDIGLLATTVKVAGEATEGYHVFVGGGFGRREAIGRQVFQGISFEQIKPTLEQMLKGYLRHRQPGESFRSFTERHNLNALQVIFSGVLQDPVQPK